MRECFENHGERMPLEIKPWVSLVQKTEISTSLIQVPAVLDFLFSQITDYGMCISAQERTCTKKPNLRRLLGRTKQSRCGTPSSTPTEQKGSGKKWLLRVVFVSEGKDGCTGEENGGSCESSKAPPEVKQPEFAIDTPQRQDVLLSL